MMISNRRGLTKLDFLLLLVVSAVVVAGFLNSLQPEPDPAEELRRIAVADSITAAGPPPPIPPELYARLESSLNDARSVVSTGLSQALRILEVDDDANPNNPAVWPDVGEWNRFMLAYGNEVNAFSQRLARAAGSVGLDSPAYPMSEELKSVVSELQELVTIHGERSRTPTEHQAETYFERAREHLNRAGEMLPELQ